MANKQQAEDLRLQADESFEKEDFKEAIRLYTAAIRENQKDPSLYFSRSLAYMRTDQYCYALLDAEKSIALSPQCSLGYCRRGDVQFAAGRFSDALLSYQVAFLLQPNDRTVFVSMTKAKLALDSFRQREKLDPWLCTGVGLIFGAIIAVADWTLAASPSLKHPVLIVLLTLVTSSCGYGIGRAYRFYLKIQRDGMLQPPLESNQDSEGM
ncbi:unnamed protein product, partial [Notodromas monacha]